MSFKINSLTLCIAFATAILVGCSTPAEDTAPAESFVAAQFTNTPAASALVLTGQVAVTVQEILGHRYRQKKISYWQAEGKTVWVLETRGRSNTITAGFVVREGRLEKAEVLVYRERRGRQIQARSFTRQFEGVSLAQGRRLDRRIDGITGATISVNAMRNLARAALFLHEQVNDKVEEPVAPITLTPVDGLAVGANWISNAKAERVRRKMRKRA